MLVVASSVSAYARSACSHTTRSHGTPSTRRPGWTWTDSDLATVVVGKLVEREQSRFVRLNDRAALRNAPRFGFECSRLEAVRRDEDEWSGHEISLSINGQRSGRASCRNSARRGDGSTRPAGRLDTLGGGPRVASHRGRGCPRPAARGGGRHVGCAGRVKEAARRTTSIPEKPPGRAERFRDGVETPQTAPPIR